jgi:hypothetical protein
LRWPQFSRLAAYRLPPMLPRLTAVVMAADTLVVDILVVDILVADILVADISGLGTDRAHGSWLDLDPPHTSGMDFTGTHSACADTGGISGMAVGGITALVRAGYGPTITASTCGSATKILERHFGNLNWSAQP